ncbi:MAG: Csu type fimbrial protein [Telluria sp.]
MRNLLSSSLLACAMLGHGPALAAGCSVSSSGLAFGRYEPLTFEGRLLSVSVTSDATISVACTGIVTGGAYSIALGPSMTGGGDRISTRYLSNPAGGPDMAFNVYRDPSYTSVWGDGITAGATLGGTIGPGDSNLTHTVYGRIPGGQNTLRAGSFSTSMTITISYNP